MNRRQRSQQLIALIRAGERGNEAVHRVRPTRLDLGTGPDAVHRNNRQDAIDSGVYQVPSQYNYVVPGSTVLRRSRRAQGLAPRNSAIATPPYKVTMRNNVATSCNGPDHVFRGVRCKHMMVAERLFRAPTRRSERVRNRIPAMSQRRTRSGATYLANPEKNGWMSLKI